MSLNTMLILAGIAIFLQLFLIFGSNRKYHLAIIIVFGALLGSAAFMIHYIIYEAVSVRPLLKAFITSGLISLVSQVLVNAISKYQMRSVPGEQ